MERPIRRRRLAFCEKFIGPHRALTT